ncbi:uncharacterized protein LOC129958799 isoform X1 [Argiope bruennichi]|uniref:Uncharacterized protein n=1 Tax=Argiope bruennichi TaxID=94029 RepID=A0A8T0F2G6_ARGBR|nr:uncharacterized protein LOC129958799 isoform X1 [Argiope bruennichi]XP_055927453.1 uncharacterized protein LOC129958799 isoform X1 [Argiope bruennichi]XP_055927454.1 uncharacterized protein LOC129958799 isoform X1 [Argiope bruennichi]XP_055927455.1 uncharacterized protein LOC129958799 isoform X1 [Argiope bruennichi]XP_055927456.1 uncharacterized protein LOC129958799 isoform X1 [Argiope bruennichi]KAF8785317.1 hypothetical protein HNY73_010875 [Argiope bruennichi]
MPGNRIVSKERKIVRNVLRYFENECSQNQLNIQLCQPIKKAAEANGVSTRTVNRIKREVKNTGDVKSPLKRRRIGKLICSSTSLDDFDFCVIRQTVSEFYARNEVPSLRTLLPAVKEKINFPWKVKTLRHVLQKIGFKWKRSVDKRKIVMKRPDIVQWKYKYLRDIKKYRDSKRVIVYLDETWIDSNLSFGKCWQLNKIGAVTKQTAGKRLIVVHAGNQDSFIEGASLIFQSGTAKGDYHGQMNYDSFSKWLQEKLLPNIPPHCVICMGNASYHTKVLNSVPSKYSTKKNLSEWLEERNIPFDVNMCKPDLYDLIVSHAPPSKMFCVDEILKANGHYVLRIPPYHCDLNGMGIHKKILRNRNVNGELNITTLRDLTINGLLNVTKNEWKSFCDHAKKVEKKYWEIDNIVEQTIDEINFVVGDDSDDSEANVSAESDFEYDSEST